jgi:hypothetical protein
LRERQGRGRERQEKTREREIKRERERANFTHSSLNIAWQSCAFVHSFTFVSLSGYINNVDKLGCGGDSAKGHICQLRFCTGRDVAPPTVQRPCEVGGKFVSSSFIGEAE